MGSGDWIIGVLLGTVGAVTLNLGTNLMKRSHVLNSMLAPNLRQFYVFQWRWIIGFTVFLLGNVFDFVALSFAAQSVIAPLGAMSILSNIFFASFVLGESFRKRDAIGTGLVIVGAVLAVAFGDHEEREYTWTEIENLFRKPVLWIYWIFVAAISATLCAMVPVVKRAVRSGDPGSIINRHVRLHPVLHIFIGGIVGAQTIIGAKILSELLRSLYDSGRSPFRVPGFYAVLIVTVSTAVAQIHQFQLALRMADALFVVPAFFCVWTFGSIVGGGIFFGEFEKFSVLSALMFPLGVLTTFCGVLLLAARLRPDDVRNDITPTTQTALFSSIKNENVAQSVDLHNDASERSAQGNMNIVLGMGDTELLEISVERSHEDDGGG